MHMRAILLGFGWCLPFHLTAATMLYVMDPSIWPLVLMTVGEALRMACWFGLPKPEPALVRPEVTPRSVRPSARSRAVVRPVKRGVASASAPGVADENAPPVRSGASGMFSTIDEVMRREG